MSLYGLRLSLGKVVDALAFMFCLFQLFRVPCWHLEILVLKRPNPTRRRVCGSGHNTTEQRGNGTSTPSGGCEGPSLDGCVRSGTALPGSVEPEPPTSPEVLYIRFAISSGAEGCCSCPQIAAPCGVTEGCCFRPSTSPLINNLFLWYVLHFGQNSNLDPFADF